LNSLSDLMIGKGSNRAGGGINLEVWFPQQNEVSIFLESSITDAEEEQFYETCLFALYAARQIANLGADGASLAYVLQTTDTTNPLRQAEERLDEVRVSSPRGRAGRKGFTCTLRPNKRASFKLNAHGFGMMGTWVGYYAPTSTLGQARARAAPPRAPRRPARRPAVPGRARRKRARRVSRGRPQPRTLSPGRATSRLQSASRNPSVARGRARART
jgi:hypothetical protein